MDFDPTVFWDYLIGNHASFIIQGVWLTFYMAVLSQLTAHGVALGPLVLSHGAVTLGAVTSAIIALSLNEGAYMAEIVRAGIGSVDAGQVEAAKALGMTYPLTMRRIILPQAIRF